MEQKTHLQTLRKSTQEKQLTSLINSSKRAKSFPELWKSKEPSFALIRKELSEPIVKMLLMTEIQKMVEISGAELSEIQIDFLIDFILKDYFAYTISDLTLITKQISTVKCYGAPRLQNIIIAFEEYSYIRDEYAVKQRQKESEELKNDIYTSDEMTKVYLKLKEEKDRPKKSRKEKDQENNARLQQKIKELQSMYPTMYNKK